MDKNNRTVQFSFVQATFWMGFAAVSAFASVYLLDLGISNSAIGTIIALGALVSALTQPVIGSLIDNNHHFTLKRVLGCSASVIIIASMMLYPVSGLSLAASAVLYGLLIFMIQLGQPFTNALGMASQNSGCKLYFGPARAIGSLGYAAIAYFLGLLTESIGANIVPLCIALIFLIHFLSVVLFPLKEHAAESTDIPKGNDIPEITDIPGSTGTLLTETDNSDSKTASEDSPGPIAFLKKYSSFSIMLLGMIFVYFAHVTLNSFTLQIITTKGGSSDDMGLSTAIAAATEIVPMMLFPFILKKVNVNVLLRISVVFFTLKVLFTYLSANVTAFLVTQLCQMLGWGIMAVAIVYFVNDNIDRSEQAQGQAFAGMALTAGNFVGGFFGGFIIDGAGIDALLIIGLIMSLIGSVIFIIGIRRSEKNKTVAQNKN